MRILGDGKGFGERMIIRGPGEDIGASFARIGITSTSSAVVTVISRLASSVGGIGCRDYLEPFSVFYMGIKKERYIQRKYSFVKFPSIPSSLFLQLRISRLYIPLCLLSTTRVNPMPTIRKSLANPSTRTVIHQIWTSPLFDRTSYPLPPSLSTSNSCMISSSSTDVQSSISSKTDTQNPFCRHNGYNVHYQGTHAPHNTNISNQWDLTLCLRQVLE